MTPAYDQDTSEFDVYRKKAQQQVNAQKQGAQDALKRRFASMGNINSGAYIKANQNVEDAAGQQMESANEGINAAQTAELRRRRELASNQEFAANEAAKGRQFQSGENALQRAFSTQERLGGQSFAAAQAEAQRKFQTGERLSSQDFAALQAKDAREFAANESAMARKLQETQIGNQADQFNKQYELDKKVTDFNMGMAADEANRKNPGILGSILGDNFRADPSSPLGKILNNPVGGAVAGSVIMGPVGAVAGATGGLFG